MTIIAHQKLPGLDSERVIAAVEPVLRAHGVEGVELVWKTDRNGWLLELTIEKPGSTSPGEGISIDLCSEVSRDLSAALDVADLIAASYRLEVGSPGLERALYLLGDFERFAGRQAKLKLRNALDGQKTFRGLLKGVNADGCVLIATEDGELSVAFEDIDRAQLLFDWSNLGQSAGKSGRISRREQSDRGAKRGR